MAKEKPKIELTPIIKRALLETVTDIGQLSDGEQQELDAAVKAGYLAKGKGGPFPVIKTVYAVSTFDFAADRQRYLDEAAELLALDEKNQFLALDSTITGINAG